MNADTILLYLSEFQNIDKFNTLYLRSKKEFDNKKPHFRTFQIEIFPTRHFSVDKNNFEESYDTSKFTNFRKKVVNYSWHSGT